MQIFKQALLAVTFTSLMGCAHQALETPVQSGDSTLFTSDVGPIDHENLNEDSKGQTSTTVPASRANQHSSIKTPKSADYGAPTGSTSGSGSNP